MASSCRQTRADGRQDRVNVHGRRSSSARTSARTLAAHGITHRVYTVASSAAPAEVLLDEVQSRRPRLLLLGAHREHPLRDLFATSVTRARRLPGADPRRRLTGAPAIGASPELLDLVRF